MKSAIQALKEKQALELANLEKKLKAEDAYEGAVSKSVSKRNLAIESAQVKLDASVKKAKEAFELAKAQANKTQASELEFAKNALNAVLDGLKAKADKKVSAEQASAPAPAQNANSEIVSE